MSGGVLRQVASEWRKVTTTKLLWILVLASIAFNGLQVALLVLVAPGTVTDSTGLQPLDEPAYITYVLAVAGGASLFALILGIIGMTGEYRHMTITSTLLASPRRGRMLLGKGVSYALIGAVVAVANVIAVTAMTAIALSLAPGPHAAIDPTEVGKVLFGVTLGLAIYAVLGMSIGALIKNQVGAIVLAVVWVLLLEPLLGLFLPDVAKWLPGSALSATMSVSTTADLSSTDLLPVWGGALLLIAYAVVLATLASFTTVRRDIT